MERHQLAEWVKLVAFGYLLLHLNVNLGTLNVLPNWLGYVLMLRALPALGEYEPSALLLRPIGIFLTLWEGFLWVMALLGVGTGHYLFEVIATVIALYFHFQLLTNLADLAVRFHCGESGRILTLRTVRTVLVTLFTLPVSWEKYSIFIVCIMVVNLIVALWICAVLFSFRRSLEEAVPGIDH